MSRDSGRRLAPHVEAAITAAAQPKMVGSGPKVAAHVRAAISVVAQPKAHPPVVALVDGRRPDSHFNETAPAAQHLKRRSSTVAQAMLANLATKSSQATYLTASLMNANGTYSLCTDLANGAAGHSEDIFINTTLPANAGSFDLASTNHLFIGLNRSPCTSTDYLGNGKPSCNKGGGAAGCAENLAALAAGFAHGGNVYTVFLHIQCRGLYGSDSDEEANSSRALEALNNLANVDIDFQRTAESQRFLSTKTATKL